MIEEFLSPLRRRMIEDMTVRRLVLMGWTPPNGVQHLHFGTSMPSGGVHPIRTRCRSFLPCRSDYA